MCQQHHNSRDRSAIPTNSEDTRLMLRAFGKYGLRQPDDGSCRWRRPLPWGRLAVSALFVVGSACRADEAPPVYSHFGYCAAPVPPACIDAMGQSGPSAACRAEAEAYVASVFRYRECLSAEMQRAVREANGVIDRIRCAVDRSACDRSDAGTASATGKADAPRP